MMQTQLLGDLDSACGSSPGIVCDAVHGWTDSDNAARLAQWVVEKPFKVILIMLVAWILVRVARRSIDQFIAKLVASRQDVVAPVSADAPTTEHLSHLGDALASKAVAQLERLTVAGQRSNQRSETLGAVLKSVATGIVWTFAALIALAELGISLGPLVAGAGIAGIAVGFGAQSLVKDFLAGIFIVIEDQYGVGDVVDVGDAVGTIEGVSLRTTRLRDLAGVLWVVPNGEIRRVGNMSQLWSRTVLDIGVAYDTDLDKALAVMKQAADEVWALHLEEATIIEEPYIAGVQELGDSAVVLRLTVKTDPAEQWAVARLLRKAIKDRFDENGIEIPFPQATVHVRNEDQNTEDPES
jgi:small-conductance mechanosensitive channel